MMRLSDHLLSEFEEVTGTRPSLTEDFQTTYKRLCEFLETKPLRPKSQRRTWLFARINAKFRLNRRVTNDIYAKCAKHGVTFNYHQKVRLEDSLDHCKIHQFTQVLRETTLQPRTMDALTEEFCPATEQMTLNVLRQELKTPSMLRRAKGTRDIAPKILTSCFAAFAYSVAKGRIMHEFFDSHYDAARYESSSFRQLQETLPELFDRSRVLDVVHVDLPPVSVEYVDLRVALQNQIADSYRHLNNFGHFAVYISPIVCGGRNVTWELASDVMIYAEKLHACALQSSYFKPPKIEALTVRSVPNVDPSQARFDLVNEGFTYRDSFVIPQSSSSTCGDEAVLIIFQKNKRDETLIPCPSCRSHVVRGNSYSTMGVRSWECANPLCPDRSKYNRGKRYSFKSILMQEAIEDPGNAIPVDFVRTWMRDVQIGRTFEDCLQMLVRHYTLLGDVIQTYGFRRMSTQSLGRRVIWGPLSQPQTNNTMSFFDTSPWFKRYCAEPTPLKATKSVFNSDEVANIRIVNGDARDVLASLERCSVDGAVTSPPYYNAKQYSQWPNIYAYLSEMLGVCTEMFRVLRPGSFFLYNIFDYFDNENSVVFSAMGNKRLILSAYTVDLFRRVGFVLLGNVAWDKGHIEGRRGFNGGNFSPYYQSPFNCWEHILAFWKPNGELSKAHARMRRLPSVLCVQPVVKMHNGVNSYGHDAPYPETIPQLLLSLLPDDATVVDPFAGSGTTGRALGPFVRRVICVEKNVDYFRLSVRKCSEVRLGDELDLPISEENRENLFSMR